MKFINTRNTILSISKNTIRPFSITRNYTDKELVEDLELARLREVGVLVEYTGQSADQYRDAKRPSVDGRYDMAQESGKEKLVTKQAGSTVVQYIVADSEGSDSVPMSDPDTVVSFGDEVHKSPDFIESGVDAGKFKTGADAMEAALKAESDAASYDDEDTLADNEPERNGALDVDHEIAVDATQTVLRAGKFGAQVKTVESQVKESMAKGMAQLEKEVAKNLDEKEIVPAEQGRDRVVSFLKQPLNAKKFAIAKETDKTLLKEISSVTQSEKVKALVRQRLVELK